MANSKILTSTQFLVGSQWGKYKNIIMNQPALAKEHSHIGCMWSQNDRAIIGGVVMTVYQQVGGQYNKR